MSGTEKQGQDKRTKKILSALGSVVVLCFVALAVAFSSSLEQHGAAFDQGDKTSSAESTRASQDQFEAAHVVRVVDGDTLIVSCNEGESERVRLIGINAPESVAEDESRNCEEGRKASEYMKSLVGPGTPIWLTTDVSETDQYNRLLRYVWLEVPEDAWSKDEVETKMLNGVLVAAGYAEAREYAPDTSYAGILEEIGREALSQHKGVSYYWG